MRTIIRWSLKDSEVVQKVAKYRMCGILSEAFIRPTYPFVIKRGPMGTKPRFLRADLCPRPQKARFCHYWSCIKVFIS